MSFPLQNNSIFGIGEFDRTSNVANFQPVISFLNGLLITRKIIPFVNKPIGENESLSVAGDENARDVCSMLLQYFINYNFKDEWSLSSAPIVTANWEATASNLQSGNYFYSIRTKNNASVKKTIFFK